MHSPVAEKTLKHTQNLPLANTMMGKPVKAPQNTIIISVTYVYTAKSHQTELFTHR